MKYKVFLDGYDSALETAEEFHESTEHDGLFGYDNFFPTRGTCVESTSRYPYKESIVKFEKTEDFAAHGLLEH